MPVLRANGFGTGIGDIALHYRYQAAGNPEARTLVAPRASLLLPTGSRGRGRGAGEIGAQVNLPVTFVPVPSLATHWNAGFTAVRGVAVAYNLGASAVWLVRPSFKLVLEGVFFAEDGEEAVYLNPGFGVFEHRGRAADCAGVAYTVEVGPSRGEEALFAYLSFEHAFASD